MKPISLVEIESASYIVWTACRLLLVLSFNIVKALWHRVLVRNLKQHLFSAAGNITSKQESSLTQSIDHDGLKAELDTEPAFIAGKTCLFTGVTQGIGRALLQRILALPIGQRPRRIIFLAKSANQDVEHVKDAIQAAGIEVCCRIVNLEFPLRVLEAARQIVCEETELHLLVINAGVWSQEQNCRCEIQLESEVEDRSTTKENKLELHVMVNFMAAAILVRTLQPLLQLSALNLSSPVRIIITGSFTAFDVTGGLLRHKDLQLKKRPGSVHFGVGPLHVAQAMAYAHSKLLLHMYAKKIAADHLDDKRTRLVVVDPGVVNTDLHASLQQGIGDSIARPVYHVAQKLRCLRSPAEGAAPLFHCCVSPEVDCLEGGRAYYCDWGRIYTMKRKISPDMTRFPSSDIDIFNCLGFRWPAVSASLADDSQCQQVVEFAEEVGKRLEAELLWRDENQQKRSNKTDDRDDGNRQSWQQSHANALQCEGRMQDQEIAWSKEITSSCNVLQHHAWSSESTASSEMSWSQIFYLDIMVPLSEYLPQCPPGPPLLPLRHLVNLQKGGTLPLCLFLMWYYGNWSKTACTYTALHGGYGLCWLLKDVFFCDPATEKLGSAMGLSILSCILTLYWYMPFAVVAFHLEVSCAQQAVAIVFSLFGTVLMMVADCHKFFALKYNAELALQKQYLIDDGVFSTNRNPNYLGEMILYSGFALLTGPRLEVVCILVSLWVVLFGTNMIKKDLSLSKKPGWDGYKRRSHLFLFRLWSLEPLESNSRSQVARKLD